MKSIKNINLRSSGTQPAAVNRLSRLRSGYKLSLVRELLRAQQGVAAVEFAMILPLMIAMTFGTVEVSRYILIAQKVERVSITIADLVTQNDSISTAQLNLIIPAAGQIMLPYNFTTDGYAIVSAIKKIGTGNPAITWQYRSAGTTQTSRFGTTGGTVTLPSNYTMLAGDSIIVTEIFFAYRPILSGTIYNSSGMYRYSIFKPRLGDLSTLSFNFDGQEKCYG